MKLARNVFIFSLLCLIGCQENQPDYQLIGPVDSERMILIEEFSGARCPNCPQGTLELENLKSIYGSSLVLLTIHAGDFAFKYDDSKYDFTTPAGNGILQLLGNPIGYPSAVINRTKGPGESGFQVFSSKWSSLVSDELSKPQRMGITLETLFDDVSRSLSISVSMIPFETINVASRLTVLLKEDGIQDPQADRAAESGVVRDYIHKNVLRDVVTDFRGDPLGEQLEAFQTIDRTFNYTLLEETGWWKAEKISVVAFVSLDDDDIIEVVQASEQNILP